MIRLPHLERPPDSGIDLPPPYALVVNYMGANGNFINLAGKRFGYLVAMHRHGKYKKQPMWLCRCDCGQETVARGDKLRSGRHKACGINRHHGIDLGLARLYPYEYKTWVGIHRRCAPKGRYFKRVRVCKRWAKFDAFLEDMGVKPTITHTIERINVFGHYKPGNCRWATRAEQYRNLRRSVYVTYQGKRALLLDVAKLLGLDRSMLYGRLKMGWSFDEAISTPVRKKGAAKKEYTPVFWGKTNPAQTPWDL